MHVNGNMQGLTYQPLVPRNRTCFVVRRITDAAYLVTYLRAMTTLEPVAGYYYTTARGQDFRPIPLLRIESIPTGLHRSIW